MKEMEAYILAANTMKSIARNEQIKQFIRNSEDLYPILSRAAQRFIAGETKEEAISEALSLHSMGYFVSLEYIGENIVDEQQVIQEKNEFLQLIRTVGITDIQSTISLDLSHIGMMIDEELTYQNLVEIAQEASRFGITIMIGAEESAKTDRIHSIYRRISQSFSNVGITLQAYLHRTESDLQQLKHYPGRMRLVKGAYQEPIENALPRSEALQAKYLYFIEKRVLTGLPISIATHDEMIIEEVKQRGYLDKPNVELEMLYGIRPDILKKMNEHGYRTRCYLTYGKEWHLYFFHRLSEYPLNIFRAIADMAATTNRENLSHYFIDAPLA